ncbi:hypothetical protein BDQ17DRAFT_1366273 [Cyathus striatus]|nr:hypothetical protein BDQ17DRAFT_1366273 [Cyathus striatus]
MFSLRVFPPSSPSASAAARSAITLWLPPQCPQSKRYGTVCSFYFAVYFFNGSISTLATDRFSSSNTFTKLGAAQGVNQAAQCVGAILIAPLIKRWPTRTPADAQKPIYGTWDADLIFLVWTLAGISYGMVELIRRVIPADIVGGDVSKLRRMDAVVHIFYEVAGTSGAFASSSAISRFGNNYSFFLTPIFFAIAGVVWIFISALNFKSRIQLAEEAAQAGLSEVEFSPKKEGYTKQVLYGAWGFVESVWVGFKLVFGNRCFIWLFPSYALALYCHRFLESSLGNAFAKRVLGTSAWSQIITGGSNFGELLGALGVLVLSDMVPTPLPWLRMDALTLNIVWILPHFAKIATHDVGWAWKIAGCFIPISMGWAAGDVSLAAYIQSSLSNSKFTHKNVSPLGAVMAFLYSTYIVLNAVFSSVLGKVIDEDYSRTGNIESSLTRVGGIHFSVCCAIILASTFIPKGSFSFNPKSLGRITTGRRPTLNKGEEQSTDDENDIKKDVESFTDDKSDSA